MAHSQIKRVSLYFLFLLFHLMITLLAVEILFFIVLCLSIHQWKMHRSVGLRTLFFLVCTIFQIWPRHRPATFQMTTLLYTSLLLMRCHHWLSLHLFIITFPKVTTIAVAAIVTLLFISQQATIMFMLSNLDYNELDLTVPYLSLPFLL